MRNIMIRTLSLYSIFFFGFISHGVFAQPEPTHTQSVNIVSSLKQNLSTLVEKSQQPFVRLLVCFLLGILMSLTPCIYPMIPITVGALQASRKTTLLANFTLALSYILGMAFTFAFLGLLAASGSAQFGLLLGNPIFVIILVSFLLYLALSMLGLYDMYVPRFLQPRDHSVRGGSYSSAFIFGIISGTVASPCLSPGLLLLLSIVATLGNKLWGFLLLYAFGLGLGFPLLLIGTFSNSLNLLPRAGAWMIEVKRLFGFMLIGMCFYYLNNIWPHTIVLLMMAASLVGIGIFYVFIIGKHDSRAIKTFKYCIAILCLCTAVGMLLQAYKETFITLEKKPSAWLSDYDMGTRTALEKNKLLMIDFGAAWCSSCTAIEKRFFENAHVLHVLSRFVLVHIDCTNPQAESCASVQSKFNIIGFPTIILVDPQNGTIVKKWGAELLDTSIEQFIQEIEDL